MANLYVRSTDGSDADNGSTWALAKATLAGAAAIDAAGDTIYVSQAHSESTAGLVTLALAGTAASPTRVICGNDAAEPPTAVASYATVVATGTIQATGAAVYMRGLSFQPGSGSASGISFVPVTSSAGRALYEACEVRMLTTGAGTIELSGTGSFVEFVDFDVRFNSSTAGFRLGGGAHFEWRGGALLAGGTSPAALFVAATTTTELTAHLSGIDLSAAGSTMNLFTAAGRACRYTIRNSRLPASWSGSLLTGSLSPSERAEMHNCDSGDTNYRLWVEDYCGSIKTETTIVRTGGASDGTTAFSWKLASSANAEYPLLPLVTPELPAEWNATVGSSVTATVEIVTDGVTLTDGECWLEVQYLGTSGYPLSSFASDAKADVLATAANQAASTESWTTTGLASPTKQKLSVTVTPQEAGFIQAVVKLAKASTTVYVDPKITLT